MGALGTSSYQVTLPGLVATQAAPACRPTGRREDTEVGQVTSQIGTGHCLDISSLSS